VSPSMRGHMNNQCFTDSNRLVNFRPFLCCE
jgi:hypothetical protein